MAAQQGAEAGARSINRWQATGEERSNGWPFGLQLGRRMSRQLEQHLFASASLYTPSVTSDSSSDLDTQSTGSFFPEKSTTLGSLIGIQSSSSQNKLAMAEAHQMMIEAERRKSGGALGARASWASWCSMLGCAGGSNPEAIGMSPSLAHLLEEERRASTGSQRVQCNSAEAAQVDMDEYGGGEDRNTLFDGGGILPPQPAGAPLRLILQHTSPGSTYPSADWDVYNGGHSNGDHHIRGAGGGSGGGSGGGGGHGRFPATSNWRSSLCGRLASGLGDVL